MTTNPVRPGHATGDSSTDAPGGAGTGQPGQQAPRPAGGTGPFDFVLRGYDRTQVDARIADLLGQLRTAHEQLQTLSDRLTEQQQRSEQTERELRAARPASPAAAGEDPAQGFGYRAERLLRMAEAEANEIRAAAIKEASETLERARAAAETHRHEIEQNLIMRATTLDQQANEVSAALREREQSAAAELAAARSEADAVRVAARKEMEQARRNVEIVARDVRAQAERWAEQHRAGARAEAERLTALRENMRRELSTLSATLLTAVHTEQARTEQQRDGNGPRTAPPARPPGRPQPGPKPAHRRNDDTPPPSPTSSG